MNHEIKSKKVEYTSGENFTKGASLPEKMCCGNAIVIGKGSEQTIYLSGGLRWDSRQGLTVGPGTENLTNLGPRPTKS